MEVNDALFLKYREELNDIKMKIEMQFFQLKKLKKENAFLNDEIRKCRMENKNLKNEINRLKKEMDRIKRFYG